jgi:hypothetical protein
MLRRAAVPYALNDNFFVTHPIEDHIGVRAGNNAPLSGTFSRLSGKRMLGE